MCFSAEASLGAAIALLPAGAYCIESAWRKDRSYIALAIVPVMFGLQQLCEGLVWIGLERENPETIRVATLGYLFFALAVWPVWIPLAVAAIEPPGWRRLTIAIASGVGVLLGIVYYSPIASDGARGITPTVIGHSIRYDAGLDSLAASWWWVWAILYLAVVSGPLLASRAHGLRPLGTAVILAAAAAYGLYHYASASVWCFFAAILSLQVAYVLFRLPDSSARELQLGLRPSPLL